MTKSNTATYIVTGVSALAYLALAYATPRTEFVQLLVLYAAAFGCYLYLINAHFHIWYGIGAAVVFRLLFLFAEPALSDDYFRFIWDGRLLAAGMNPYLHLPKFIISGDAPPVVGITTALYQQLNSPHYYSIYPPVSQAVFLMSAELFPANLWGNVLVLRVVLLLAELGSILLLLRLLRKMALPDKHVLLYALNPLVILELVGNLHFEALLIFFLLLSLHQLFYQRFLFSGVAFGLAIGTKLLPLMFLPFLLRRLGPRKFLIFGGAAGGTVVVVFYPLLSMEVIQHIFQSLDLYFQKFEFNAGIYFFLRWIGYKLAGFNIIMVLGPLLSLITLLLIVWLATKKRLSSIRRMAGYMAAALTIYLFLATTVHPWYLTTLLALTTMSRFRFAVVWSGFAILSYAAYQTTANTESMGLILLEYTLVFLWLLIELYLYRQRKRHLIAEEEVRDKTGKA
ncbi:glycosyltransferase 87 family protein [Pontibacter pamirensis]|uniref:glycosyltransferase 87 family protein n=1 Tax=Pontibacter pamirensis TaxID=2562824 RepID=UPI001389B958|nr:glycosyltransferase 87 family protein [Pontibacter pamirensis]